MNIAAPDKQNNISCAHVAESRVNIWHDLRKRPNSTRYGMAKYAAFQGHVDGLGMDSEFKKEEIFDEIKQIAIQIETLGDANTSIESNTACTSYLNGKIALRIPEP